MKIKVIDCDHPQYWYVNRIGEVFEVSDVIRTDFITEPDGHLVLKRHAEIVEEEKPMNKITEDCYVNVAGWTEQEVQKAAEMFAEALDAKIDNIETKPNRYHYLFKLNNPEIFVGDEHSLNIHGRVEELTKEDLFGVAMEPTDDFQRAWESVWNAVCNHAPENLRNQDGSGVEIAVELIKTLSKYYEEPVKSALDIQHLITFTTNHKNFEISIEGGKIVAKDWRGSGEPVEYTFNMLEQLEEFMNAWEVVGKYNHREEGL